MTNSSTTPSPPHKVFCVTNIKSYVPLILDLDRMNYDAWRELFTTHCEAYDTIEHIDNSYDAPTPKPTDPDWKKVDSVVKGWIYSTLSQNLLNMILKKETYARQIKAIADLLENLDPTAVVPDKNLVIYTINGLNSRYANVASIIRHRVPFPSFDDTRSILLSEEQLMLLNRSPSYPAHVDHSSSPSLLHASSDNRRQERRHDRRPPQNRNSRRPSGNNNHSGPTSQTQQYGWVFIPPPGPPQLTWSPSPRPNNTNGQWAVPYPRQSAPGLLGPYPQRPLAPPAQAHFSASTPATGQPSQSTVTPPWTWFGSEQQPTALPQLFSTMSLQDTGEWVMDTGATDHVHENQGILHSLHDTNICHNILVGDGSKIPVVATGHTFFPIKNEHRPLYLNNVLITPSIIKNLISVRKFTRHNKCSIEFDEFGFTVKDYRTRIPLIRCDSDVPLYPVLPQTPQAFVSASSSVWHQRLGHPDNHVLQFLFSNKLIPCNKTDSDVLCQACQLGKHIKLPFSISDSHVSHAFEIIHSDVWTSPITSALHMAAHLLNILPSTSIQNDTPTYRLFNKHPTYTHLRTFGCLCFPHITTTHKLSPRSSPCVFLGYPSHHQRFRCLDLSTRTIIISRHVTFDENTFPFKSVTPDDSPSYSFLDDTSDPSPYFRYHFHHQPDTTTTSSSDSTTYGAPSDHQPSAASSPHSTDPHNEVPSPPPDHTDSSSPPPIHPMTTRSRSGIVKPIQKLNLHTSSISPVPRSHLQAIKDPNWRQAMNDEYSALISNGTWTLVPRPPGVNIVRSMWLFRHKFNADGSLSRYKARLVANGRSQQQGIDCDETFSPVVKPATIRIVLSIAVSRQWPLHQLDVKNAFLHGHLQETVYMHQPPGFRDTQFPDHVCHLKRSLYGLKQAPRAWYHRFAHHAATIGFQHSRTDSSLFILHTAKATAYLLLYVDDIILTASSTDLLQQIIDKLSREFAMTDLGSLHYFLGISAVRSSTGLFLSQRTYALEILEMANMTNCNPCRTPAEPVHKLDSSGTPVADPTLFRSLAGALQYLTFTRPDIAFAVQQICLYMHDPREPHLHALKRILRYLRGTLDHGLQLHISPTSSLIAYSDADWGGCPATRRSTSGYCVFLGDNLISWSSKRQGTISRSSAEAEYRGVANAVAETSWIRNLLLELRCPTSKATIVYCDNVSAVYMSSNLVQHQRTKHIEIDIHFVRDKVALGHIRVLHVPSTAQYADIFTKGLPTSLFSDFRSSLNVRLFPPDQTVGGC
ncbi:hypothetical protein OSB04_015980 [Centaurea solstitialis]|uniref:Uncharacterized protein n=1 Tax=Centaurea solstitialis TaxID=347529 RepID=A0AA38TBZ5_9ASTR|nr:hypothetical protein OSB04_015980 [Centaurea solstitialis]